MDGTIVLQQPQPGLAIPTPIGGGGLASTANDYGRFVRMLLNGGELDGARVLKPETVALMGENPIGAVSVPALKTALPRSADFTFIADGRDKLGLGFLITADQVAGQTLARQPELGRHQQYLFLDRSGARPRRRDHDAVPAVRRRQSARSLRRVRARRLSARGGKAVEAASVTRNKRERLAPCKSPRRTACTGR